MAALVLPLLVLAVPRPAQAQLSRLRSVIALEFGVLPSVKASGVLGRNATDAVAIELAKSGEYDVRPRSELSQSLQEQQLTMPLDVNGIQRLGSAMSVDYALGGDISKVEFTPEPRRARVTISVRLIDVATGEFVNGAIETQSSPIPPSGSQPDDETLINQAINNAAYAAVKTMNERRIPEATVLIVRGTDSIRINRGVQDGIQSGMDMVILRGRDKVGRVRVNSVQAGDATATITDWGKGIKPEDRARYVFTAPDVKMVNGDFVRTALPDISRYRPQQGKSKSILSSVLGIVGAVLLVSFLTRTQSSNTGANIVGVTARAYAAGDNTTPGDSSAARTEITWKPAGDINEQNIIEYHIYRNGQLIGVSPRSRKTFTDGPFIGGSVSYNEIVYGGGTPQGAINGGGVGTGTTGATTGTTGATTGATTGTTAGTTTGTTAGTTGTGNTNSGGEAQASSLQLITVQASPMPVGITNRYTIGVLFQRLRADLSAQNGTTGGGGTAGGTGGGTGASTGIGSGTTGGTTGTTGGTTGTTGGTTGGTGGQIIYQESNVTAGSGPATPVVRPDIKPGETVRQLRSVTVTYQTVTGANQYAVEFASDPSFKNKIQFGPFFQGFSSNVTTTEAYDISAKFKSLKQNDRVYFRVGARNSLDQPGPTGKDSPNSDNYIYSQDGASFGKQDSPPGPPSSP